MCQKLLLINLLDLSYNAITGNLPADLALCVQMVCIRQLVHGYKWALSDIAT
jgi:hypothetical protein